MRVVQINGGVFGSTGKIMGGIKELMESHGHEVICASPVTSTNLSKQPDFAYIKIGDSLSRKLSVLFCRLTGLREVAAPFATLRLLRYIKKFRPDVIHLHNIHGDYINLPMLFRYIKKYQIKTVWTLHDCWAFTGHCPYFDMAGCEKWRTGCSDCPSYRHYPKTVFDDSHRMYRKKKSWFCGVGDMTLVTPSKWLAELVKDSFLREYDVQVIPNGIDLGVFRPTESDFRKKHLLEDKTVLLGVSFVWGKRKGVDIFSALRERLDNRYAIVLVGTNDEIDGSLPSGIITVHRTTDIHELAQIYTASDIFVNPTREDNYPTVNMEAIACGTPVITFNTGGSPEMIGENCGSVVEKGDTDALIDAIKATGKKSAVKSSACVSRAKEFDETKKYLLYEEIYTGGAKHQ